MTEEDIPPICMEIIKSFGGTKKGGKYYVQAVSRTAFNEDLRDKKEYDQKDLATIGDSVLDLLAAEKLFLEGKRTKGEITIARSSLVDKNNLWKVALKIELQEIIIWGSDERDKKVWLKGPRALETSMEAIFGGLFLARGYMQTKKLFDVIFSE